MKKIFLCILALALLIGVLAGCGKQELSESPITKPTRLQLAGGQVSVTLPEGFYADRSAALAADQIGRYCCQDNYTLEIFQVAKKGNDSLQSVADSRAQEMDAKAFKVTVEDNVFMCYNYQEMTDGRMITVTNYVIAAKQCFLVLSFHHNGSDAQARAIGAFLEDVKVH